MLKLILKGVDNSTSLIEKVLARLIPVEKKIFITARNKKTMGFVNKWLEYKKIQLDNVIVVNANESKAILDYNIFLDDSPIQVKQIAHSKKIALVYNQPWNREIKENNNIIRVKNLFDVILFVRKFVEDFK